MHEHISANYAALAALLGTLGTGAAMSGVNSDDAGILYMVDSIDGESAAATIVLGANVHTLSRYALGGYKTLTLVCFRAEDAALTFESQWYGAVASQKQTRNWTVYTDNTDLADTVSALAGQYFTVSVYPLSEWGGTA